MERETKREINWLFWGMGLLFVLLVALVLLSEY